MAYSNDKFNSKPQKVVCQKTRWLQIILKVVWANHYSVWISLDGVLEKSHRWFGKWKGVSNILDKIVVWENSKPLFREIKTPIW